MYSVRGAFLTSMCVVYEATVGASGDREIPVRRGLDRSSFRLVASAFAELGPGVEAEDDVSADCPLVDVLPVVEASAVPLPFALSTLVCDKISFPLPDGHVQTFFAAAFGGERKKKGGQNLPAAFVKEKWKHTRSTSFANGCVDVE